MQVTDSVDRQAAAEWADCLFGFWRCGAVFLRGMDVQDLGCRRGEIIVKEVEKGLKVRRGELFARKERRKFFLKNGRFVIE